MRQPGRWLSRLEHPSRTPKHCGFDPWSSRTGGSQSTFLSHINVSLYSSLSKIDEHILG